MVYHIPLRDGLGGPHLTQEFVSVRILDNFYQTSSFFPMPVVLMSTVAETGQINLGPYSLCFPYTVAKEYAMMLIARENSNTSRNIQRTGVCAINFVPDDKRFTRNCVSLGFPGETTAEKMKNSIFTLLPSTRMGDERQPGVQYPDIVGEAIQVFECTWDQRYPLDHNSETLECRFILRVDKIVMQKKWRDRLYQGKGFPHLPVDYGYRNNTQFWFTRGPKPYAVPIPKSKGVSVDTVQYAADRYDPDVEWQEEACAKLVRVPRVFLKRVIAECVEAAKEEGVTEITPEFLDKIRDKRRQDKGHGILT
jgi:flavin reductase (DIM6/NTAB) family NADH-FMN oxidoreductase RutF